MQARIPLLRTLKSIIPPLTNKLHKGQLGKIGIVGGSLEYTGAPYFAGMSAQQAGADLVTIICPEEAGIPIKCYSPELIVYPVIYCGGDNQSDSEYDSICSQNMARILKIIPRIDSLVIGPGAGRHPVMLRTMGAIIHYAIQNCIPLVIDGDGLWVVTQNPSLVEGSTTTIMTPNQMEFTRLWNSVRKENKTPDCLIDKDDGCYFVSTLASTLHGVTILQKGEIDRISNGITSDIVTANGSLRRCGGQGDVIAGVMGVMAFWSRNSKKSKDDLPEIDYRILAACATSFIVRNAASVAFDREKRGMTASSIINELPTIIDKYS